MSSRHRKANSFPDANTPGDPRLLAAIARRTPSIAGGSVNHFPGGTVLTPQPQRGSRGGKAPKLALTLVKARPSYVPVGTPVADGFYGIWLTWGFVNERLPTNWSDRLDVSLTTTFNKKIYLKAYLAVGAPSLSLVVTSVEWVTSDTVLTTPNWGAGGTRPAHVFFLLGTVSATVAGTINVVNNGGGSVMISDYVHNITQNGVNGFKYDKSFSFIRSGTP